MYLPFIQSLYQFACRVLFANCLFPPSLSSSLSLPLSISLCPLSIYNTYEMNMTFLFSMHPLLHLSRYKNQRVLLYTLFPTNQSANILAQNQSHSTSSSDGISFSEDHLFSLISFTLSPSFAATESSELNKPRPIATFLCHHVSGFLLMSLVCFGISRSSIIIRAITEMRASNQETENLLGRI